MTSPSGRAVRVLAGALGLAVATAALQVPTVAQAAPTPKQPTGVRVVAVSDGGFTVALRRSQHAKKYRIWATTTKSRLALSTVRRTKASAATRKPRVAIRGLAYTSAPYYFRVQAIGAGKTRFSGVYSTRLRASTPTGLRVASSQRGGTTLTWGGRSAARYVVQQATSARMNTGVRTWATRSVAQQFSPYGLRPGTRYWFRVRAENGTASAWSPAVSTVARSRGFSVRMLTYNVLRADRAGARYAGGERVGTWAQRRPKILAEIRRSRASVVALQEGSAWVTYDKRQVQSICEGLGGRWEVAGHFPDAPCTGGDNPTGRYLLFDAAVYKPLAARPWTLVGGSNPTHVAYAVLQHRATGASFVAVSAHLLPAPGAANDRRRRLETQRLIANVNALRASRGGIPAVYAGDMNSAPDVKHPLDGPGVAFRAVRVARADQAARALSPTARYNSSNQLLRTPPAKGVHVDSIWAPPGVGVDSWAMMLTLSRGRFSGVIPSDHNAVAATLVLPY